MSRLAEQYPQALQIAGPKMPTMDTGAVFELVEPYLGWVLAEIDTLSTDILIGEPLRGGVDPQSRRLVILSGQAVNVWLRHRGGANPRGKPESKTS